MSEPALTKFIPKAGGCAYSQATPVSKVVAARGATEAGTDSIFLHLKHDEGNEHKLLLSIEGARAIIATLGAALDRQDNPASPAQIPSRNDCLWKTGCSDYTRCNFVGECIAKAQNRQEQRRVRHDDRNMP